MKICGCSSCRRNGEVDPHELFEIFYAQREESGRKEFENIFLASYTVGEMKDIYEELEPQFNSEVVNRIKQYSDKPFDAQTYWYSYGGSLSAFNKIPPNFWLGLF